MVVDHQNEPKYFGIDLDQTFFVPDSTKFKENIECFNKLKTKNIIPFFCTGRSVESAMKLVGDEFAKATGYYGFPGVYANGAIVYDENGKVVNAKHFERDVLQKFIDYVRENDKTGDALFMEVDGYYSLNRLDSEFEDYAREKVTRKIEVITSEELIEKKIVSIKLDKSMDVEISNEGYVKKVSTHDETIHISPANVTKAYGLTKLFSHWGLDAKKCVFIGNGDNDIELLELCELSYAVGNAADDVKAAAKVVLKEDYDQGAFVKAVELFCAA